MTTRTLPQVPFKLASETLNVAVDMTERLASGETLSGTPTITASSTDITLSSKVVNSSTTNINGNSVAVGKAMQCAVAGGVAGNTYYMTFTCGTSASQTVSEVGAIEVR